MITIILADDHTVVRNGLRLFLNLQAGMAVQNGHRFLTPKIADALITNFVEQYTVLTRENPLTQLSDRERQVLQLVVEGKTSLEISQIVALSPKTVETYRSRLMRKLGIEDLPTLVKFAIQQGITTLD